MHNFRSHFLPRRQRSTEYQNDTSSNFYSSQNDTSSNFYSSQNDTSSNFYSSQNDTSSNFYSSQNDTSSNFYSSQNDTSSNFYSSQNDTSSNFTRLKMIRVKIRTRIIFETSKLELVSFLSVLERDYFNYN